MEEDYKFRNKNIVCEICDNALETLDNMSDEEFLELIKECENTPNIPILVPGINYCEGERKMSTVAELNKVLNNITKYKNNLVFRSKFGKHEYRSEKFKISTSTGKDLIIEFKSPNKHDNFTIKLSDYEYIETLEDRNTIVLSSNSFHDKVFLELSSKYLYKITDDSSITDIYSQVYHAERGLLSALIHGTGLYNHIVFETVNTNEKIDYILNEKESALTYMECHDIDFLEANINVNAEENYEVYLHLRNEYRYDYRMYFKVHVIEFYYDYIIMEVISDKTKQSTLFRISAYNKDK